MTEQEFSNFPSIDTMNHALRPLAIYGLVFCGLTFLFGLGIIMLLRYAEHGEIDWQGLAAFGSMFLLPLMQHFQNRHDIQRIDACAKADQARTAAPVEGRTQPAPT